MSKGIKQSRIVGRIKQNGGYLSTTEAKKALKTVIETIIEETIMTGDLTIFGFGRFQVKDFTQKKNPMTGKPVNTKTVRFKPGTDFKRRVTGKE